MIAGKGQLVLKTNYGDILNQGPKATLNTQGHLIADVGKNFVNTAAQIKAQGHALIKAKNDIQLADPSRT